MKFYRQLRTSAAQPPVNFQGDWSIFPNYTQLSNRKKFVGNSLVARRTTQGTSMSCPFHLWVAFGDQVTVFGQHCRSHYTNQLISAMWHQGNCCHKTVSWHNTSITDYIFQEWSFNCPWLEYSMGWPHRKPRQTLTNWLLGDTSAILNH